MTTADAVLQAIAEFLAQATRPVLFAGAGVSVKAGLPTWDDYLTQLAEQIRPADQLTRHLMMECLRTRQYTRAAEYFFLSEGLTDGEKNRAITSPLQDYDVAKVAAITALPFAAYVTTNYDRVLLDAYASQFGKAASEVNLADPTMKAAPFTEGFYVARIHGRVEVPGSMVLSKSHYERLHQDTAYVDFLRHLFSTRSLLFVGFSFLDPAIQMVLRAIRDQIGGIHSGNHLALVDSNADAEFLTELNRHHIRAVRYSPADSHSALWEALSQYRRGKRDEAAAPNAAQVDAFSYARQYFAAALTRRKMSSHMRPLKQAVAEGMVLQMLVSAEEKGLTRDEITSGLADQLNLLPAASGALVDGSLQGLASDGLYQVDDAGRFRAVLKGTVKGGLHESIDVLVDGAIDRLVVREHGSDNPATRKLLANYFEYLVLRRGWDMGAAYAAHRPPQAIVVEEVLAQSMVDERKTSLPSPKLVRAIEGVLLSPSEPETKVLAELGRMAFALELVRQAPQDTLFSTQVLPTRIYLDTNVLMPAIVQGHPFNALYSAAIEKLLTASAASSAGLEVCAYFGFLNEVVSHRRLARDDVSSYGDRAAEHIEREVRLYSSANMNVFVAGFARTLMTGEKMSFDDYLRRFAPYDNENQLAAWLRSKGIRVVEQRQMLAGAVEYPALLHHFEVMFAQEVADKTRTAILIAHDALQIARLLGDVTRGDRAVFVTADKRMRDAVAYSEFQSLGSAMLSGVGLVQMIDLLVGAIGDERSMAGLLWSTRASSPAERVRRYLVDIALAQYDAALAMNMESVIRELTEDITFAMEQDRATSKRANNEEEVSLSKYVEAFEPRFYELMRAEQEKLEAKKR
jgi:hypothetical protein